MESRRFHNYLEDSAIISNLPGSYRYMRDKVFIRINWGPWLSYDPGNRSRDMIGSAIRQAYKPNHHGLSNALCRPVPYLGIRPSYNLSYRISNAGFPT
ncbi:hypothetical protein AVEN_134910-1 [Araneus ventricosus]|uniref:Uncharacterized protein n=1 Tax=Araneus ventricosus TaxID=182803 RepID=A0A4Y2CGX5_ARAVE|nr:hypothetical protein AVEN_134910-1 [Araneus ventricosus]